MIKDGRVKTFYVLKHSLELSTPSSPLKILSAVFYRTKTLYKLFCLFVKPQTDSNIPYYADRRTSRVPMELSCRRAKMEELRI